MPRASRVSGVQHTDSCAVGGFFRDESLNVKRRVACLGPRDAAKPVSGPRGHSPKNHAADSRQGIVSFPRHPEGAWYEHFNRQLGWRAEEAGGQCQAALPWLRPAEASGLPVNFHRLGGKSISERTHSLDGVMAL